VCFPFENQLGRFLFTPTTNGLAAGLTIEEAICHALAELVERDAWSLWSSRLAAGDDPSHLPLLNLRSVPRSARVLLQAFARARVDAIVRVITSDIGIAAFHAASIDRDVHGTSVHEGMSAHPDAEVALVRALTELAQSRAADIQGSREDLRYWRARAARPARAERTWVEIVPNESIDFDRVPSVRHAAIRSDIEHMVAGLGGAGLDRVLVVDLTTPQLQLPVVRVIVPGLEVTCVDPWRIGARVRQACAGLAGVVAAAER
jgi:ribosomal protein S12 methylthiotransferase accessory factor